MAATSRSGFMNVTLYCLAQQNLLPAESRAAFIMDLVAAVYDAP